MLTYEGRALGSTVGLFVRPAAIVAPGARRSADDAWAETLAELAAVDRALSRFRDDSELTLLNRRAGDGGTVDASWRLRELLAICDRARRVTSGRFDACVVEALERIGEHGANLEAVVTEDHRLADPMLERPSRVCVPSRPVDSGGIGKGLGLRWAARRASRCLEPGGGLLLDAGGDIVTAGSSPADGWRVGVEDPVAAGDARADPLAVIALSGGALATSSVAIRRWTDERGVDVHHLIDPATGQPARTGLLAVTVAGPDPAWCEVWTKALFLAGAAAIADEARARGLAAWWVDAAGALEMTPAARLCSVWVDEARLGSAPAAPGASARSPRPVGSATMVARTKEAPMAGPQPEPRTIAGRAWLSGMRPPHRRAAAPLVASIEREAAAPYLEALRLADAVLGGLVAIDPARADGEALARLVKGAGAARELARPLLDAG